MSRENPFTDPFRRKDGEMNQSNLIQRLEAPWFRTLPDGTRVDNPFNFGGGLKNGGLKEEAMALLRDIFSFDYMGAAEFEFGAVPEALQAIAQKAGRGEMVAFSFALKDKDVAKSYREDAPLVRDAIYVICANGDSAEVERRIKLMALGKESYYRKPGKLSLVYDATDVDLAYLALFKDMDEEDYWSSSGIDQPLATEEDSLLGKGDDNEMVALKKLYAQAKIGIAKAARVLCEHASAWESQGSEVVDVKPVWKP